MGSSALGFIGFQTSSAESSPCEGFVPSCPSRREEMGADCSLVHGAASVLEAAFSGREEGKG